MANFGQKMAKMVILAKTRATKLEFLVKMVILVFKTGHFGAKNGQNGHFGHLASHFAKVLRILRMRKWSRERLISSDPFGIGKNEAWLGLGAFPSQGSFFLRFAQV